MTIVYKHLLLCLSDYLNSKWLLWPMAQRNTLLVNFRMRSILVKYNAQDIKQLQEKIVSVLFYNQ